jgi:hypothetical protein
MLGFLLTLAFGTTRKAQFISCMCRRHLTPDEIPWCSFLLEAEWNPGLLTADRNNETLVNFQGTYRVSNLLSCSTGPQLSHRSPRNAISISYFDGEMKYGSH